MNEFVTLQTKPDWTDRESICESLKDAHREIRGYPLESGRAGMKLCGGHMNIETAKGVADWSAHEAGSKTSLVRDPLSQALFSETQLLGIKFTIGEGADAFYAA